MRLTLVGMDVFIVFALIRLGRWSEDWLRELFGLLEPGWQCDTVDSLTLLVFIPSGTWKSGLMNTADTAPRSLSGHSPVMYPRTIASTLMTSHFRTIILLPSS
jgi:hypothetical protein